MKAFSYIRWSSSKQTDGDSLRRQTEMAAAYAAKHALELDNSTFQDHGISAFKGKNLDEGALGAFLKAVDKGTVKTPCYLLVEALDRITRADTLDATQLFTSIIKRNVFIVVLQTEQVFSPDIINGPNGGMFLFAAISSLVQGNEDSKKRGKRVKEAWDSKRAQQKSGVIASSNGPSWLTLSDDRKKWLVDRKKAAVVKRIFKLALAGNGALKIKCLLNGEGVPPISSRGRKITEWGINSVAFLLNQEAVFGRYRQTRGSMVVDDYYPPIVARADFDRVQAGRTNRRGKGGRQMGNNVFSGLLWCAYCQNGRLKYNSNGVNRVPGAEIHVRCRNALEHSGCDAPRLPYAPLESDILNYLIICEDLDLHAHELEENTSSRRRQLEEQIAERDAEQKRLASVVRRGVERGVEVVAIEDEIIDGQVELNKLQKELADLVGVPLTAKEVKDNLELMYQLTVESTLELRLKVQQALYRQIKRIEIAPNIESRPELYKSFGIKKSEKFLRPCHKVKITYVGGRVGITDVTCDDEPCSGR